MFLPGTSSLEVMSDLDEDGRWILGIERVLGEDGRVIFDVQVGHDDAAVEEAVDLVGVDYLDWILDLTCAGDIGLVRVTLGAPS